MANWNLTDKQRKDIKPLVEEFLDRIESLEDLGGETVCLDLTFKEISPAQLKDLFEELGYEGGDFDSNGWQYDFWQYMLNHKKDNTHKICICGCGMTFELKIMVVFE